MPDPAPSPERRAERALFKTARNFASRFLRRRGIPEGDRADLEQEAIAAASSRRPRYEPERGSPAAWLRGFLIRVVWSYQRKQKSHQKLLREVELSMPAFVPAEDEDRAVIEERRRILHEELLPRVPSEQRAIIVAHDIEGQEMAAVAAQQEISLSTAYHRRELGRAALKKAYASYRARQKDRGLFVVPLGFGKIVEAVRAFLRRPGVKAALTHGLSAVMGAALYGALRGREAPAPIDPRPPVLVAAAEVDAPGADAGTVTDDPDVVDASDDAAPRDAQAPAIMKSAVAPSARIAAAPKPAEEDALDEEHLFDAARSAFVRGDFGGALAALDDQDRRFPGGPLAGNREVLRVKALVKAGRASEARARLDRLRGSAAGRALAERLEPLVPSSAAPAR